MATTTLDPVLTRLARFTPADLPVVSLYLDFTADQHGQLTHDTFLERAFDEPGATFASDPNAQAALARDLERIRQYLATELALPGPAAVAVFSSDGGDALFEAIPLQVALDGHLLYVDRVPHLFPLARLAEQYKTYAAVLLDTNRARVFVCATGEVQRTETVENDKTQRVDVGGWSQARYQRHVDHLRLEHIKEVAAALDRVVRDEGVTAVILAGDAQVVALLRKQLHPTVDALVIDEMRLPLYLREHEVLSATLDAYRRKDEESDREVVDALLDQYRSRGLATIGLTGVQAAFTRGQVDVLVVPATPAASATDVASADAGRNTPAEHRGRLDENEIESLVAEAGRTSASVRFIEDASLLEPAGGVGAFLRFRI